jgi:hypothetical protein
MAAKTPVPTKIVVNCSTGEQSVIELTAEEIADFDALRQGAAASLAEQTAAEEARATAKASAAAKLAALGLTTEEIAALNG